MDTRNNFLITKKDVREIELFAKRPTAVLLLYQIAIRAKRTLNHPDKDLLLGEALIGDWKIYCDTERCYRTDKAFLQKHGKATFRSTNKGTIARIISTSPFDINEEKMTNDMIITRQTNDDQVTTNNNEKKEKNEKENTDSDSLINESLEKIQRILGSIYTYKDGRHYYLKGGYLEEIHSPIKFAKSLCTPVSLSKLNPILEDPQFKQLCAIYLSKDDIATRRKMILEPLLDKRYPRERYDDQWREADRVKRGESV